MLDLATNRPPILSSIAILFEALHGNDMLYCNLKGNDQHLKYALSGDSDIDVLFDAGQKDKLEELLLSLGFKKFQAIREKRYRDIVDFIFLDPDSGRVIHLHTHYGLTLGEPFLKGYQLDLAQTILHSRVYNERFDLYCIPPALEMALLYVSEALKVRHRDILLFRTRQTDALSEKAKYQYNWLKARTTFGEVEAVIEAYFNNSPALRAMNSSPFNTRNLLRFAPGVRRDLAAFRLYTPTAAVVTRWYREASIRIRRRLSQLLRRPIISIRTNPRGGIVVAVLEAEESEKTGIAVILKDAFAKKVDVFRLIFPGEEIRQKDRSTLAGALHGLVAAWRNLSLLRRAHAARKKGAIVFCEHHRMPEEMIHNDSALPASNNIIVRWLARQEFRLWKQAGALTPDLVLLFRNDRQNTVSEQSATFRMHARSDGECTPRTVVIDPGNPLSEALICMKKEIWKAL